MDDIKTGKCKYDFIEVMACPGGCIDGGVNHLSELIEVLKREWKLYMRRFKYA